MNRRERRAQEKAGGSLRDRAAKVLKAGGSPVVRLEGGPMDTWLVAPDAPALSRQWGRTVGQPGYAYRRRGHDEEGTRIARWERLDA